MNNTDYHTVIPKASSHSLLKRNQPAPKKAKSVYQKKKDVRMLWAQMGVAYIS